MCWRLESSKFAAAERAPGRLLRLWREQRFELIVSAEIVTELLNTLAEPYFRKQITPGQIELTQILLQAEATETPVAERVSGVASHTEDDRVLDAAVSAEADYLVTGDRQL